MSFKTNFFWIPSFIIREEQFYFYVSEPLLATVYVNVKTFSAKKMQKTFITLVIR